MKTNQLLPRITPQGFKLHCLWCLCSKAIEWFTYDVIKMTVMQIESNWSQFLIWYAKYDVILSYLISKHLDQRMSKRSLDISCEPKKFTHFLFEGNCLEGPELPPQKPIWLF